MDAKHLEPGAAALLPILAKEGTTADAALALAATSAAMTFKRFVDMLEPFRPLMQAAADQLMAEMAATAKGKR